MSDDPSATVIVSREALRPPLAKLLIRKGMFAAEADIAIDRLIDTEVLGRHEHGLRTLPRLLEAMDSGDIDPRARVLTTVDFPAGALLDGSTGMGHVAVSRAMTLAVEKAREVGMAVVAIRNSQPCGESAVYTRLAARQGFLTILTTSTGKANTTGLLASPAILGDHPVSVGVPTRDGTGWSCSMTAASVSAAGLNRHQQLGGVLPDATAWTADGQPASAAAEADLLRPAGGLCGIGLALMSSALTTGLTGSRLPLHKRKRTHFCDGSEHVCVVIDPARFGSTDRLFEEWSAASEVWRPHLPELFPPLPAESGEVLLHRCDLKELAQLLFTAKQSIPWESV